jgi:hypothetical protein
MINLYTVISRKFINDPSEEMKIKSKGIYLQKDILEKLGIEFEENLVRIPYDIEFKKEHYMNKFLNMAEINFPEIYLNKEVILNSFYVTEWEKEAERLDSIAKTKWINSISYGINRDEFDEEDDKNIKLERTPLKAQKYFDFNEFETKEDYNYRIQPLYFDRITNTKQFLINPINFKDQEYTYLLDIENKINSMIENNEPNEMIEIQKTIYSSLKYAFMYSKLVPVDIHIPYYNLTEEELQNETPHYITLWYYPTEEFLNVLPEDVREKLILELELVDAVQKGEIQPEEACITVEEESLLGLCNLKEKNLSELNVYPNPVKNNINIKYNLEEDSFCKIFITNSNGNYLKDATEWVKQSKGTIEIQQDISDLNPGVYILHIVNENGDKLISKFAKE